jgi:hypothetical protein
MTVRVKSRTIRSALLVHALSFACFSPLATPHAQPPDAQSSPGVEAADTIDWREHYAYTLGMQAYIFGFPYVYLPSLRWDWVTRPKSSDELPLYAPVNHFSHVRTLADASYRGGGSPNQDTLYSAAWLDVAKEPVILSHPDMGDRYFAFQLAGIDSTTSPTLASAPPAADPGVLPSSAPAGRANSRRG